MALLPRVAPAQILQFHARGVTRTSPMRHPLARLLVLALAAAMASAPGGVNAMAQALSDRIDAFVAREMERERVPGLAVAVVQKGIVTKAQGYGLANVELRVPVSPETIFQSGSLGKQFTAAAVMLQVEAGRLSLSDPIAKFFPDAPKPWRAITVRHLLTHTSGIPDYTDEAVDTQKNYTEDQLAKVAYGLPLEFVPGSRWNYSNTGYVLLGIIVHKVSGRFYGDVLAEAVFKPLGMTTARVISEADIVPNRAAGYELHDGAIKNQAWVSPSLNTTADGSLYFSVNDLIGWDRGVRARAILKPESWNEILTPVRLTSGKPYPYGFGWSIEERGGQPLHEHSGAWQGFKTEFARYIGDDLSVIVLANLAQADPQRFGDGIAAIVNPALAVPALSPMEDREPQVTARLASLLETARRGALSPPDFAYLRAGFFPEGAKRLQARLAKLGPAGKLVLVGREERGDDRIYTYDVAFGDRVMRYFAGLAPDGRISRFGLAEKD
jgi:CubicO group peptidase (beta-lactamase class C family)